MTSREDYDEANNYSDSEGGGDDSGLDYSSDGSGGDGSYGGYAGGEGGSSFADADGEEGSVYADGYGEEGSGYTDGYGEEGSGYADGSADDYGEYEEGDGYGEGKESVCSDDALSGLSDGSVDERDGLGEDEGEDGVGILKLLANGARLTEQISSASAAHVPAARQGRKGIQASAAHSWGRPHLRSVMDARRAIRLGELPPLNEGTDEGEVEVTDEGEGTGEGEGAERVKKHFTTYSSSAQRRSSRLATTVAGAPRIQPGSSRSTQEYRGVFDDGINQFHTFQRKMPPRDTDRVGEDNGLVFRRIMCPDNGGSRMYANHDAVMWAPAPSTNLPDPNASRRAESQAFARYARDTLDNNMGGVYPTGTMQRNWDRPWGFTGYRNDTERMLPWQPTRRQPVSIMGQRPLPQVDTGDAGFRPDTVRETGSSPFPGRTGPYDPSASGFAAAMGARAAVMQTGNAPLPGRTGPHDASFAGMDMFAHRSGSIALGGSMPGPGRTGPVAASSSGVGLPGGGLRASTALHSARGEPTPGYDPRPQSFGPSGNMPAPRAAQLAGRDPNWTPGYEPRPQSFGPSGNMPAPRAAQLAGRDPNWTPGPHPDASAFAGQWAGGSGTGSLAPSIVQSDSALGRGPVPSGEVLGTRPQAPSFACAGPTPVPAMMDGTTQWRPRAVGMTRQHVSDGVLGHASGASAAIVEHARRGTGPDPVREQPMAPLGGAYAGTRAGPQAAVFEANSDRLVAGPRPDATAAAPVHGAALAGSGAEVHREHRPAAMSLLVAATTQGEVAKTSTGRAELYADGLRPSLEAPRANTFARLLPSQAPAMSVGTSAANRGHWFTPGAMQQPRAATQDRLLPSQEPTISVGTAATNRGQWFVPGAMQQPRAATQDRLLPPREPTAQGSDAGPVLRTGVVETGAQARRVQVAGARPEADLRLEVPGTVSRPAQMHIGNDHPLVQNQRPSTNRTDMDVTVAAPQHVDLLRGDRRLNPSQALTMASGQMDTNALPEATQGTRRQGQVPRLRAPGPDIGNGTTTRTHIQMTPTTTRSRSARVTDSPSVSRVARSRQPRGAAETTRLAPVLNKY